MFTAAASFVAVAALPVSAPVNDAVMTPAAKLPDPSRATIVLIALAAVAVVAELKRPCPR
jgi:hypothetical protein